MIYTAEAATEYGIGQGPNGTGKRALIKGAYTLRNGRKIRAFTGKIALQQAQEWAKKCQEYHDQGNPSF